MKKIKVDNKTEIKKLLYTGYIIGLKGNQFSSFDGFQLWWYDKKLDVCNHCESHWINTRKKVAQCSLNKAASTLWHHRRSLFLRHKRLREDKDLMDMGYSATINHRNRNESSGIFKVDLLSFVRNSLFASN